MNKLDIYYRAFLNYREHTLKDNRCLKERKDLKKVGLEFDHLETIKYLCDIDEDWITEIEKGLKFIEKAIAEERQFIRTNSEVVPIEKVKRVAKQSIDHLARHSELITRKTESDEDKLIPEKLLMVEKLSDYAVYENRFLYMLLCYLRDFINLRLEKIEDLRRKYVANFTLNKEVISKKHSLRFDMNFYEQNLENLYPIADDKSEKMIIRIKDCQQLVLSFLGRPLMMEVSKTPMIKPPVVKTNVLKMNHNFKGALALYEFVSNYTKPGYTSSEVKKEFQPFSDKLADEFTEIINLTSFLSYEYGNELEEILKSNYLLEEEKRLIEEEKKLLEQIKRLKKRILEEGYSPEEYMLLLEKRNRALESDHEELKLAREEIIQLNDQIDLLKAEREELNRQITFLKDEMERIKIEHQREMEALSAKHLQEVRDLKDSHEIEIQRLNNQHEEEIQELEDYYQNELDEQKENFENEIKELHANYSGQLEQQKKQYEHFMLQLKEEAEAQKNALIDEYNTEIEILNNKNRELLQMQREISYLYEEKVEKLGQEVVRLTTTNETIQSDCSLKIQEQELFYKSKISEQSNHNDLQLFSMREALALSNQERDLARAELHAMRLTQGLTNEESFLEKERFAELEREFLAFNRFFKEHWNLTKKNIRKEILWSKGEKNQNKDS